LQNKVLNEKFSGIEPSLDSGKHKKDKIQKKTISNDIVFFGDRDRNKLLLEFNQIKIWFFGNIHLDLNIMTLLKYYKITNGLYRFS